MVDDLASRVLERGVSTTGTERVSKQVPPVGGQTDTIGVRMIMDLTWLMRRTGMVQTIANVTW